MRKFLLLTACTFLVCSFSYAQKIAGTVKGNFVDSSSAEGLSDATISVMTQKDSSLISFTLSSNSGYFEIKNLDTGAYVLLFSFQGYPNLKKNFSISHANTVADFGTVKVAQDFKMLGEVVVTNEVPIKVKGDTIAYNADAFKVVKPNATAEDLLKKLPGVQVERDGTVKAQGENVQKIYVDGKEFFGNDPKLATKNLTADMIDQVEVYDDISDQAKFTGMDDGSRAKAINLKLKKNKNKGTFGRAMAGYGTDDRYQSNISANYFKGATKVSAIARANNTNNVGFSNNDMVGGFGGNSSGITKNWMAGVNYSDLWGTKLELTGSYFFNHTNNYNNSESVRETKYSNRKTGIDSLVRRFQQGLSDNNNDNHRINLRMIYTIDSMSSIIYTPSINFQNSSSERSDTTSSFNLNADNYKVLDSWSDRENTGEGFSWTNNIIYRRKFQKRGRSFSVGLSNTYNSTDREALNLQRTGNYKLGQKISDDWRNQKSIQENGSESYGVTVSYTEPIARDKVLEFNYAYNKNSNESDRKVYDYNSASETFDYKNQLQSNLFENGNESNRIGTNYRVVKKKYNYQLGMAVQRTTMQSDNLSKNTFVEETYTNLFPTAVFNYQFARSKNLRFNYRGRTSQPNTSQLQEVPDLSNALNWTKGYAGLNQEYSNNIALNYNSFDMVKFRNFFFRVNFSNTLNKIVNNVITDSATIQRLTNVSPDSIRQGVQLTVPVNANGSYNVGGNINIGFPINSMKGGNFNASTSFNKSQDVSFQDSIKNFTKSLSLGERLRLSYNHKEKLDIGLEASVNYTKFKNTLNTGKDENLSSRKYYTYSASADISYIFPKNFVLSTDLDYYTNTGLAEGYNQAYTLWNASLSKQMLKNNRGELKLSVFDILKQNRSISRNFSETYFEDVQNSVVRQFFMLSFTYNLNRMGGNSGGGNRMMQTDGGRSGRMMQ